MTILKFRKNGNGIALDKLRMEDITEDKRTALLDRSGFICPKFRIDEGVYIAKNDLFFKMARLLDTSKKLIDAMLIREKNAHIVIVPSKSYVFWNGRSVEPEMYHILQNAETQHIQDQIVQGRIPA